MEMRKIVEKKRCLSSLERGQGGRIEDMDPPGDLGRRLEELGMIPGTWVECVGKSPLGDPAAYLARGAVFALRRREAERVWLSREGTPWE